MTIIETLQGDWFYVVLILAIFGLASLGYFLAAYFLDFKKPKKFIGLHNQLELTYKHIQEAAKGVQAVENVLIEVEKDAR